MAGPIPNGSQPFAAQWRFKVLGDVTRYDSLCKVYQVVLHTGDRPSAELKSGDKVNVDSLLDPNAQNCFRAMLDGNPALLERAEKVLKMPSEGGFYLTREQAPDGSVSLYWAAQKSNFVPGPEELETLIAVNALAGQCIKKPRGESRVPTVLPSCNDTSSTATDLASLIGISHTVAAPSKDQGLSPLMEIALVAGAAVLVVGGLGGLILGVWRGIVQGRAMGMREMIELMSFVDAKKPFWARGPLEKFYERRSLAKLIKIHSELDRELKSLGVAAEDPSLFIRDLHEVGLKRQVLEYLLFAYKPEIERLSEKLPNRLVVVEKT